MQKRCWIIVILLASIALWGKAERYYEPPADMERQVQKRLLAAMELHDFSLAAQQVLTSGGVFSAYHFTHPRCGESLTIIPLFKSAEAVSMVQKKNHHKPVFFYRDYQGGSFPSGYYLWREGIAPLWRMAGIEKIPFPTVLALHDPSNCVSEASVTFEGFWR